MAFEFSDKTKNAARLRQQEKCALDNEPLNDGIEHAHHVAPKQSGDKDNPNHAWIGSEENCVVLCEQCHKIAHDDAKWKKGATAPPSYFPHSHGSDLEAHKAWATELDKKIAEL